MENDLTTFTSPQTGTVYEIQPETQWRMAGGFLEGCPMYREEYTQYNVLLNGKQVQFCFNLGSIPEAVSRYENPLTKSQYEVLHSRYD